MAAVWRWTRMVLVYLIVFVFVPLAAIASLELGLRVSGYGVSRDFLVAKDCGDDVHLLPNPHFFDRFFGVPLTDLSFDWETYEFHMPARKAPGTCRVFVFGGSGAAGYPEPACSVSNLLRVMLEHRFPDRRFEVYNLAFPGVNSHVMRLVARAVQRHEPDFFVVYMGNNEWVGPYGPDSMFGRFTFAGSLCMTRLHIGLSRLRITQLLENMRPAQRAATGAAAAGTPPAMDRGRHDRVYAMYRANVSDICSAGAAAGARVLLCEMGANLRDWAPVSSIQAGNPGGEELARWNQAMASGMSRMEAGDYTAAAQSFRKALVLAPEHADAHFRLAKALFFLRDYAAAQEHFEAAWALDNSPMRANPAINAVLADLAAGMGGVTLVDTRGPVNALGEGDIAGREAFCDYVHMTYEGAHAVASAVFAAMARELAPNAPPDPLTAEECNEVLAILPWSIPVYRKGAEVALEPFGRRDPELLAWYETQFNALAAELGGASDEDKVASYARSVAAEPGLFPLHTRLIDTLRTLGRGKEARDAAEAAVWRFPCRRGLHLRVGQAAAMMGEWREAVDAYIEEFTRYDDDIAETRHELLLETAAQGIAGLLGRGEIAEAERVVQPVCAVVPEEELRARIDALCKE